MAEKSTLNKNLALPSRIGLSSTKTHPNEGIGTADPDRIENRVFFQAVATGNSDKYYAEVVIVQPTGSTDPYQVQMCYHHRWVPSTAKKKGAEWTAISSWAAIAPVYKTVNGVKTEVVAANSTKDPDEWLGANVGRNTKSSFRVCYYIHGTFPENIDCYSYRFRVRVYNAETKKHGSWQYSQWLHIQKAPRIANPVFYLGTSGNLIFECNVKYGERGGIFKFSNLYISNAKGNRAILKNNLTPAQMIIASGRTAESDPPLRDGFVPARCIIDAKYIKCLPTKTDKIFMNSTSIFDGNASIGNSPLTLNATTDQLKKINNVLYKHIRFGREDIVLGDIRLVLKENVDKAFVIAYVYRTENSLTDDLESATATLWYTYLGKNYSVQPSNKAFRFDKRNTKEWIARFVFTRCPIGPKLAIRAYCTNEHGSSATVANAIYLKHPYWYFQKEDNTSIFAVLQWNVEVTKDMEALYAMNLPYGRSKPFVAYGTGINNSLEIKGEVTTKTLYPYVNTEYGMRDNWRTVQNNPGIYLVRGLAGYMIRLAITAVSLSEKADSELLSVSVTGTEIE